MLSVNVDGVDFNQSFLIDSATSIANLATNINNLPHLDTSVLGQTITIVATNAGTAFTLGNLSLVHTSSLSQSIANATGAIATQNLAFAANFVAGDQVQVTVNGTPTTTSFTTDSATTLGNVATAISSIAGVSATASGANSIDIFATTTGASLLVSQAKVTNTIGSVVNQANVLAVAQSDELTLLYDLGAGMTITGSVA